MPLKIFNTMRKRKEIFKPMKNREVKFFVCGQTVYDDAHLGHAKTYVNFDVIVRFLRFLGYKVTYLQNITDVDDKIINRAKVKGMQPLELAKHFTQRFFEDMEKLNVKATVSKYPRSTDYIEKIIGQIQTLIKRGYAYTIDGDIYFDVSKFKDYTKLSRMKLEELEKHRLEPDERKTNSSDFSLWKSAKSSEISWDSPWGRGRPGWHIEDTAITVAEFGPQYDVHGGANELIFPHHTNEIAQAETATGKKPFVKYWLHSGVLKIRGEKMAKSLKNFITIREALHKYSPEAVRIWISSSHYRKPVDYSEKDLELAKRKIQKISDALEKISDSLKGAKGNKLSIAKELAKTKGGFMEAMEDDFNTPLALKNFFDLISLSNKLIDSEKFSKADLKDLEKSIRNLGEIFQIVPEKSSEKKISDEIRNLIKLREKMRGEGNFAAADEIRERLRKDFGIILEDTPKGAKWKRL